MSRARLSSLPSTHSHSRSAAPGSWGLPLLVQITSKRTENTSGVSSLRDLEENGSAFAPPTAPLELVLWRPRHDLCQAGGTSISR